MLYAQRRTFQPVTNARACSTNCTANDNDDVNIDGSNIRDRITECEHRLIDSRAREYAHANMNTTCVCVCVSYRIIIAALMRTNRERYAGALNVG